MGGKSVKYISTAAILLIIIFSAMLLTGMPLGYKHKYESRGALILSDFKDPQQYFAELSQNENFVLVTTFSEMPEINAYLGRGMNTLLTVLIGNNKNTVNIVKSFNAGGVESCLTNYGDVKTVEEFSKEECESYINSRNDAVKIFLFTPDNSISAAQIVLLENEVLIKPQTPAQIAGILLLAAEFLYPNAREVIEKTNQLTKALGG